VLNDAQQNQVAPKNLGEFDLVGEIVDSKCYLGNNQRLSRSATTDRPESEAVAQGSLSQSRGSTNPDSWKGNADR
jgi:hypothetical protein